MRSSLFLLTLPVSILMGCKSNKHDPPIAEDSPVAAANSDEGGGPEDSNGAEVDTNLAELQAGAIPEGTMVRVSFVTVSTPVIGSDEPYLFILDGSGGDPANGDYRGTGMLLRSTVGGLDSLVVGNAYDISAEYRYVDGRSELQLHNPSDAEPICDDGDCTGDLWAFVVEADTDNWLEWESQFCRVDDIHIQDTAVTDEPSFVMLENGLLMAPLAMDFEAEIGAKYSYGEGVITLHNGVYTFIPTNLGDYTVGPENDSLQVTIEDIRLLGTVEPGTKIRLDRVVVTGINQMKNGFYIRQQDREYGYPAGLYVEASFDAQDAVTAIHNGAIVNLTGILDETDGALHIILEQSADLFDTGDDGGSLRHHVPDSPREWAPYVDSVIGLHGVTITAATNDEGETETSGPVLLDDDLYDYNVEVGDHYDWIWGILRADPDGTYSLLPIDDESFEVWEDCWDG